MTQENPQSETTNRKEVLIAATLAYEILTIDPPKHSIHELHVCDLIDKITNIAKFWVETLPVEESTKFTVGACAMFLLLEHSETIKYIREILDRGRSK